MTYRQQLARTFAPFIYAGVITLGLLSIARLGLIAWQWPRVETLSAAVNILVNGIRVDLSTLGYVFAIPALLHPWLVGTRADKIWHAVLKVWLFIATISVLFFELATPAFIYEYGLRPNRLFIEYLEYPAEVGKMLLNGHLLEIVLVSLVLAGCARLLWRFYSQYLGQGNAAKQSHILARVSGFVVLALVVTLMARGTVGHRPLNPALVYFSTDPLVNSLTLNSIYSVAHAYKQMGDEKNAAKLYGQMPEEQVIELVRSSTRQPLEAFQHPTLPTYHARSPLYQGRPKNLVIVLEESLGAQFVGSLGGLPLTPEFDRIQQQGWSFKRLYATGTRSVRGIEAVITGFTPTPSRAVVKLDKSQQGFFTLAALLQQQGYETQFIYGGESHFDNMKSFFLGNGFTDVVDFADIENPDFVASWGASDGDLFRQADRELSQLHQQGKPFFSFIFTSSNHDPFEIPAGVIEPIEYTDEQLAQYDENELRRHQAIQYADAALGDFIATAKNRDYWDDTIFLLVADHDAKVFGRDLVPIDNFHIPGVILNADVPPRQDQRIVSQIDLAPTLLSLMGVENRSPMLGHDLNDSAAGGRALMQYANNFAYMVEDEVTILQPGKPPSFFFYDDDSGTLSPKQPNLGLADTALAIQLWGSMAYERGWYGVE